MTKFSKTLKVGLLAGASVLAFSTAASALSLTGGDLRINFVNVDSATSTYPLIGANQTICTTVADCDVASGALAGSSLAPNAIGSEDTWGLLDVESIRSADNSITYWSKGDNGETLQGMFYGLDDFRVEEIFNVTGDTVATFSHGGKLDLYLSGADNFGANTGPAGRGGLSTYAPLTSGTLYLSLDFTTGCGSTPTVASATLCGSFDSNTVGGSSGFLKVTGGSAAAQWDTNNAAALSGLLNPVDPEADLFFTNEFTPVGAGNGWSVVSNGNAIGTKLPEPGTLGLLGLGLAGLGMGLRRRKKIS